MKTQLNFDFEAGRTVKKNKMFFKKVSKTDAADSV